MTNFRSFILFSCEIFFCSLIIGCQSSQKIENTININQVAETDSLNQEDFWLQYTYSERQGRILYSQYCAGCHGKQGHGDGFNAYSLNPPPKNLNTFGANSKTDSALVHIIKRGGRGANHSALMPAYGNTLSEAEISYLIDYILTFSRKK